MPSFRKTIQKELLSIQSILSILGIAIAYAVLSIYLLNFHFLYQILVDPFPFFFKIHVLITLLGGLWTSISFWDFLFLSSTSLLVGINVYVTIRTLRYLENSGTVKLSIGGATLIGLVTTGCASCGLSLLSILGLSATLSFLPFHGMELHIVAIVLLIVSLLYMLRQIHLGKYCKMPEKTKGKGHRL